MLSWHPSIFWSYGTIYREFGENFTFDTDGVSVLCDIPVGTKSPPFAFANIEEFFKMKSSKFRCRLVNGQLTVANDENTSLMAVLFSISLANDCHCCNVHLKLVRKSDKPGDAFIVQLEVVKPIKSGDILRLWFDDNILTQMQIAFLVPANIQGQNGYVCVKCLKRFQYPNPLKVHISLDCNEKDMHRLWRRLICQKHTDDKKAPPTFIEIPDRTELSAFQPYKKTISHSVEIDSNVSTLSISPSFSSRLPPNSATFMANVTPPTTAAEIETLVSNLGKSKNGHLCIYCGKMYSRKYGLKIHIRTHTGFKPLKCKFCFRPFGDPSNLNKHVRLHVSTIETPTPPPYRCTICGKNLIRRRDLDRHLRSRHLINNKN